MDAWMHTKSTAHISRDCSHFLAQVSTHSQLIGHRQKEAAAVSHLSRECLSRSHFLTKVLILNQQVGSLLFEERHLGKGKLLGARLLWRGRQGSAPGSQAHDTSEPRFRRRAGSPSSTQSSSSVPRYGPSTPLEKDKLR